MDEERYAAEPAYRRMIEGARRGGQQTSERKRESSRANFAKAREARLGGSRVRPDWGKAKGRLAEDRAAVARQEGILATAGWPIEREDREEHSEEGRGAFVAYVAREMGGVMAARAAQWWRGGMDLGAGTPDELVRALAEWRAGFAV